MGVVSAVLLLSMPAERRVSSPVLYSQATSRRDTLSGVI